jgi:hypothetical protein
VVNVPLMPKAKQKAGFENSGVNSRHKVSPIPGPDFSKDITTTEARVLGLAKLRIVVHLHRYLLWLPIQSVIVNNYEMDLSIMVKVIV